MPIMVCMERPALPTSSVPPKSFHLLNGVPANPSQKDDKRCIGIADIAVRGRRLTTNLPVSASDDLELLLSKPSRQKHQSWYWRGQTWAPQPALSFLSFNSFRRFHAAIPLTYTDTLRYPGCIRGFCLPIFRLISDPAAQRKRSRGEIAPCRRFHTISPENARFSRVEKNRGRAKSSIDDRLYTMRWYALITYNPIPAGCLCQSTWPSHFRPLQPCTAKASAPKQHHCRIQVVCQYSRVKFLERTPIKCHWMLE